jgi:hypothetical protein
MSGRVKVRPQRGNAEAVLARFAAPGGFKRDELATVVSGGRSYCDHPSLLRNYACYASGGLKGHLSWHPPGCDVPCLIQFGD